MEAPNQSQHNQWPTPYNKYDKYHYALTSARIEYGQALTVIERSPYTLFMLLGDVGGLQDGLILLVRYFISFFATFALKNELIIYAENHNLIKLRAG